MRDVRKEQRKGRRRNQKRGLPGGESPGDPRRSGTNTARKDDHRVTDCALEPLPRVNAAV